MKNNCTGRARALLSIAFAGLLMASICINARSQGTGPDFSKAVIRTTKVTDNFYSLVGIGGAIGVLTGPDGLLVVDTEYAPETDKLVAAIKQISTQPIRFVVNTHVHPDHTGGNENFAKLGATIFARDELRSRLMHPSPGANGAPGKPAPQGALPVVTFSGSLSFHLDGDDVDVIAVPHAHTDGDSMVYFHVANTVMCGDFYRSESYPNIDRNSGGSLKGILDGLTALINLAGPDTKIVPGHGQIVNKSAVAQQRDMILAIRDRVAKLMAQGKTVDEVLAAHVTSDYDPQILPMADTGDKYADRFVGQVYAELKTAK